MKKKVASLFVISALFVLIAQLTACGKDDGSAPVVGQATITVRGKAQ